MRSPISLGFLTPSPGFVNGGVWVLNTGVEEFENPSRIPGWDYFTDVQVRRSIHIDLMPVLDECALTADSIVAGLISWHSSWTNLRGSSDLVALRDGENSLALCIPGEVLGGRLTLESRVVLGERFSARQPIAPHRTGSTLWGESILVQLEDGGARFPTMPVAFDQAGLAGGRDAAWALVIHSTDLTASGPGSLLLYLNASHDRIRSMLEDPSGGTAKELRDMINFDVTRQLFTLALRHEELEEGTAFEDGTLGALLLGIVRRNFPDRDLKSLRGDYDSAPGELEGELQASVRLLAD